MLFSQNIDPNDPGRRRFILIRWVLAVWHWLVPPTQAHLDRQSGTARLMARWLVITLCLAATVVAMLYARPIHDRYKQWRAGRMVQEARSKLDHGDVVGAVIIAQKAVGLAPDFEPAVRMNAELLTMISQNEAVYFWDKLAAVGTISLEDEMGRVRALQRVHREKEAAQQLEALLKKNPAEPRLMKLGEEVWGTLQSGGVLMQVLKDYSGSHPGDRESRLRLLRLQLQVHDAEPSEIGTGLWQLTEGTDETSLEALRMLVNMNTLDVADHDRLAARLDAHPLSGEPEHVMALGIRVLLRPAHKNLIIDEAISRVRDLKPEKLVPLVRWLVTHGEPGRVLSLLSESDIKKDEGLLTNYLNALMALGRTPDIARLVNDKSVTLRAATRTFYQAHLALVKGEPREDVRRKLLLVLVDLTVGGQGDSLLLLGKYCQDREFYDVAEQALEAAAMSSRARIERSGFAAWIQCCKISGNTDGMARAAREACRRWPDDQSFLEDYLYAKLLQGDESEISLNRAERLLSANPKDPARKLLAGLGYWRLGETENSVVACQGVNFSLVSSGQKAVFALILHDAGPLHVSQGDERAFQESLKAILSPIPTNARMLPEEAEMLRRAGL